jgi:hypothetical protein
VITIHIRLQPLGALHKHEPPTVLLGRPRRDADVVVNTKINVGSGEVRGFKMEGGGLRGEGTGGVYPLLMGARGLCPRKNFQITDACRRVLGHFSDKNQHIDACIYACKLS